MYKSEGLIQYSNNHSRCLELVDPPCNSWRIGVVGSGRLNCKKYNNYASDTVCSCDNVLIM